MWKSWGTGALILAASCGTVALTGCQSSQTAGGSASPAQAPSSQRLSSPARPVSRPATSPRPVEGLSLRAQKSYVTQWLQDAKSGQALHVPVHDRQNLAAAQKLWGGTGPGTPAGAGIYFAYPHHQVALGINKGDQIFDVRSYTPRVKKVSRSAVLLALGEPGAVLYADNTTIYMYPAGTAYQLSWVFPGGQGHTGNMVNHVDVYWPRGTVDLMAQNVPNPSIRVTQAPVVGGSHFGFVIDNPPNGYHLSEIEWVNPRHSVAQTYDRAMKDSEDHSPPAPGFMISGLTIQFFYPPAFGGSTGKVRLIYQNSSGTAIIGTSRLIRLK